MHYPEFGASVTSANESNRALWFTALVLVVSVVGDGWSGHPGTAFTHQLFLLPATAFFVFASWRLLFSRETNMHPLWTPQRAMFLLALFEILSAASLFYQRHHFAAIGYHVSTTLILATHIPFVLAFLALGLRKQRTAAPVIILSLAAYTIVVILAVTHSPLTYLRSDVLPVILWSDTNLLHHINPYQLILVGDRRYDFPYLPGVLVAYLPFVAAHIDLRLGSMAYLLVSCALVLWAARSDRRLQVAALLATFLLAPFLLYRTEIYLQPHWLTLVLAFILMQRGRNAWASFVFGLSMVLYQFSWLMFPFLLLYALRRKGWLEALKLTAIGALGAAIVAGPFLRSAAQRIASNTVSQWSLLPHTLPEPMNLSFWATYLIHPDKLLRFQALLMVGLFVYCFACKRCTDVADTLRWMTVAVGLFILFNVLVDGYFYLMLLVIMLAYVCIANGWWLAPRESRTGSPAPLV